MLIKEVVEDEESLFTDGINLCLFINIGSYRLKRVQVVDGYFCPFVDVYSGACFQLSGWFLEFLVKQNSKTSKQDCLHKYLFLVIQKIEFPFILEA